MHATLDHESKINMDLEEGRPWQSTKRALLGRAEKTTPPPRQADLLQDIPLCYLP